MDLPQVVDHLFDHYNKSSITLQDVVDGELPKTNQDCGRCMTVWDETLNHSTRQENAGYRHTDMAEALRQIAPEKSAKYRGSVFHSLLYAEWLVIGTSRWVRTKTSAEDFASKLVDLAYVFYSLGRSGKNRLNFEYNVTWVCPVSLPGGNFAPLTCKFDKLEYDATNDTFTITSFVLTSLPKRPKLQFYKKDLFACATQAYALKSMLKALTSFSAEEFGEKTGLNMAEKFSDEFVSAIEQACGCDKFDLTCLSGVLRMEKELAHNFGSTKIVTKLRYVFEHTDPNVGEGENWQLDANRGVIYCDFDVGEHEMVECGVESKLQAYFVDVVYPDYQATVEAEH